MNKKNVPILSIEINEKRNVSEIIGQIKKMIEYKGLASKEHINKMTLTELFQYVIVFTMTKESLEVLKEYVLHYNGLHENGSNKNN